MFATSMKLPCRHVFQLLQSTNDDLFVPALCDVRWTKQYYYKSHPALSAYEQIPHPQPVSVSRTRVPAEIEKYKKASTITKEMTNFAASMSTDQFDYYLIKMQSLNDEMKNPATTELHNHPLLHDSVTNQSPANNVHNIVPNNAKVNAIVPLDIGNVTATTYAPNRGQNVLKHIAATATSTYIPNRNENILNSAASTSTVPSLTVSGTQGITIARTDRELLANAKLPSKIVSIGRPKGSGQTIIGTLKRKNTKKASTQPQSNKRVKFDHLDTNQQSLEVVRWLTNKTTTEIQRKKISMGDIIQDANIFNRLRNEKIELKCLKKLMDVKCFKYLSNEVDRLKDSSLWGCSKCNRNLSGLQIMCSCCLDWFHIGCTDDKSATQSSELDFFCTYCRI